MLWNIRSSLMMDLITLLFVRFAPEEDVLKSRSYNSEVLKKVML